MDETGTAGSEGIDRRTSAGRYARYAFALAAVLTITMLSWQGWHLYHSFRNVDHKQSGECPTRAVEEVYFAAAHRADLIDDLEHTLVVAPEAAITPWAAEWQAHFGQSGSELDATIDKAQGLVTPDLAAAVRRVASTSAAIEEVATNVVTTAARGDVSAATAMLSSADYVETCTQYVDAAESLVRASRRFFESQLRAEHQDELISVAVAMIIFAATIGAWAVFLRRIRVGQRRLADESQQRRNAETELIRAQKMKALGTLAGTIAHDFNNLVTAIWGSASAARTEIAPDSPAQPSLARIEAASEQANELVRGLLTFGRKTPFRQVPVDLGGLVDQLAALMAPMIPSQLTLTVDRASGCGPWVIGDRGQLQQALMNLVLNARDAMSAGGTILVRVESCARGNGDEARACLQVIDSGIGMTPAVQENIFEPFFTTDVEGGKGTGLGLAIVHSVVTRHNGEIRCESEFGSGTTFTISLPQIPEPPKRLAAAEVAPGARGPADLGLVVLAEDHRQVREIIGEALAGAGYRVIPTATGSELLSAQATHGDALVAMVIDLDIPAPDGLSCIKRIRGVGVTTPILLITGTPATNLEAEVGNRAVVLRKPFAMSRLLEVVGDLTDRGHSIVGEPITVVLADDHALLRDMLRARLVAEDMRVLGCASRAEEAVRLTADHEPDVLILDIDMPGRSAFKAAEEVRVASPATRVLFLSAFVHDRYVQKALAAEASGYLTKSEPPDAIVDAVRKIAAGATQYSSEVVERIVIHESGVRLPTSSSARVDLLTDRESEVLGYVAKGLLQKQIARQMNLSVKTVQAHITNLMGKLEIHDRVELARFAIREGLVEP